MTSTPTETVSTVEAAVAARDAAQQHRDDLRLAIATGDTTITASDLAAADDAIAFALVRIEAAQLAETQEAERQRVSDVEAVRLEITDFQSRGVAELRRRYSTLVKALAAFEPAFAEHVEERSRLVARARARGLTHEATCLADTTLLKHRSPTAVKVDVVELARRDARDALKADEAHELQSESRQQEVRASAIPSARREPAAPQFNTLAEAQAAGVEWTG